MQLGLICPQRIGTRLMERFRSQEHRCIWLNSSALQSDVIGQVAGLVECLSQPRIVWIMVPAGVVSAPILTALTQALEPGDILIDGNNAYLTLHSPLINRLQERYIHYIDVGNSCGVWGTEQECCLMVGGDTEIVEYLEPIFKVFAPAPEFVRLRSTQAAIS